MGFLNRKIWVITKDKIEKVLDMQIPKELRANI